MFNIGVGEITMIVIAALILLGPERLPEAARTLGKFYREFRKQTDEVRGVVLREFYKMEREGEALDAPLKPKAPPAVVETVSNGQTVSILPAQGAVARGGVKPVEPAPLAPEAPLADTPASVVAEASPVAAAEPAAKETGA